MKPAGWLAGWLIIVVRCLARERVKGITEEFGTIMKLAGREAGGVSGTPTYTRSDRQTCNLQLSTRTLHCISCFSIAGPQTHHSLARSSELLVLKINVGQFCKWSEPKLPHVKIKLHESEGNN